MKKLCLLFCSVLLMGCAHAGQTVRVQLADNLKSAQVQTSGLVYIYSVGGGKKYKVSKPEALTIKQAGKGKIAVGSLTQEGPIVIEPARDVKLTYQKNTYMGKLYALPSSSTFRLVEYTDLEDYLLGVLPNELLLAVGSFKSASRGRPNVYFNGN